MFRQARFYAVLEGVPPFRLINLYRDLPSAQRAAYHFGSLCCIFEAETKEQAEAYAFQYRSNCLRMR